MIFALVIKAIHLICGLYGTSAPIVISPHELIYIPVSMRSARWPNDISHISYELVTSSVIG